MAERRINLYVYSQGQIKEGPNGTYYDGGPPRLVKINKRICFTELESRLLVALKVDRKEYALTITYRCPTEFLPPNIKYIRLPVVDDDSVDMIFDMLESTNELKGAELFVELERAQCAERDQDVNNSLQSGDCASVLQLPVQCAEPGQDVNEDYPGPLDRSVLTLQDKHRSIDVWNGQARAMTCRRREAVIDRAGLAHPRIVPYLQRAGFYGFSRVGFIQLDWHLVTALVERWRPETHTFHLPSGEITITLEDISLQFGLPVDGLPVTGSTDHQWHDLCVQLLGVHPPQTALTGSRLSLSWLATQFGPLSDDADEETVQRYARMYILMLLGGCLFADKSSIYVHLMFLPLLEDLNTAGRYSWGSATLAWLYRELCRGTDRAASEIAGPLILLQLWAWDRFPHIAPHRLHREQVHTGNDDVGQQLPRGPLATRWMDDFSVTDVSTHVLHSYRYHLDRQTPNQVIWQPYTPDVIGELPEYCFSGRDIWRTVSPLICFYIVEWHRPDRVLRQFGLRQGIPVACNTRPDLHSIDLRGRHAKDWAVVHKDFISLWERRRDTTNIAASPPAQGQMDYHDPYMRWYRRITRRFISRTGALHEILSQSLERICHLSAPDSNVYSIAANALKVIDEEHRLISPSDGAAAANPEVPPPTVDPPSPSVEPRPPPTGRKGRRRRGAHRSILSIASSSSQTLPTQSHEPTPDSTAPTSIHSINTPSPITTIPPNNHLVHATPPPNSASMSTQTVQTSSSPPSTQTTSQPVDIPLILSTLLPSDDIPPHDVSHSPPPTQDEQLEEGVTQLDKGVPLLLTDVSHVLKGRRASRRLRDHVNVESVSQEGLRKNPRKRKGQR